MPKGLEQFNGEAPSEVLDKKSEEGSVSPEIQKEEAGFNPSHVPVLVEKKRKIAKQDDLREERAAGRGERIRAVTNDLFTNLHDEVERRLQGAQKEDEHFLLFAKLIALRFERRFNEIVTGIARGEKLQTASAEEEKDARRIYLQQLDDIDRALARLAEKPDGKMDKTAWNLLDVNGISSMLEHIGTYLTHQQNSALKEIPRGGNFIKTIGGYLGIIKLPTSVKGVKKAIATEEKYIKKKKKSAAPTIENNLVLPKDLKKNINFLEKRIQTFYDVGEGLLRPNIEKFTHIEQQAHDHNNIFSRKNMRLFIEHMSTIDRAIRSYKKFLLGPAYQDITAFLDDPAQEEKVKKTLRSGIVKRVSEATRELDRMKKRIDEIQDSPVFAPHVFPGYQSLRALSEIDGASDKDKKENPTQEVASLEEEVAGLNGALELIMRELTKDPSRENVLRILQALEAAKEDNE